MKILDYHSSSSAHTGVIATKHLSSTGLVTAIFVLVLDIVNISLASQSM
jgi:hypothetical protein